MKKETPPADVTLEHKDLYTPINTVVWCCGNLLFFNAAASGKVIKLTGEWPCTHIYVYDQPNVTLDLDGFFAPDLVHLEGSSTLDIYNWHFERTYAPDEEGCPLTVVRKIYNSNIIVSRPNPTISGQIHNIYVLFEEMAFCNIHLTNAPSGWKSLMSMQPGARICDNNTFFPDDIPTVPCPDLDPLVVELMALSN